MYTCPDYPGRQIPNDYNIHITSRLLKYHSQPKTFLDAMKTCQAEGAILPQLKLLGVRTITYVARGETSIKKTINVYRYYAWYFILNSKLLLVEAKCYTN